MNTRIHGWTVRTTLLAAAAAVGAASAGAPALAQCQSAKLVSSSPQSQEFMGGSVGVSGLYAVVGANGHDTGAGSDAGSAYIYRRDGTDWPLEREIFANDPSAGDNYGAAVAIDGTTVAVGAPNADIAGFLDRGAVYIHTRFFLATNPPIITWAVQQKIPGPAGADRFGYTVALSGDTVAIGAPYENSGTGGVYIYTRSGTTWTLQQHLIASDASTNDFFGLSVAIDGEYVVAGADEANAPGVNVAGAAYVFHRSGTAWSQQAKLVASDSQNSARFGNAVTINGPTVVVGAWLRQENASAGAGAAYVYTRSGTSWSQQQKLVNTTPATVHNLGVSVAVNGDTALVGSDQGGAGGGIAFRYDRAGTSWTRTDQIVPDDNAASQGFSNAIALDGDTAVIAANEDDRTLLPNAGAAYVFVLNQDGANACSQARVVGVGSSFGCTTNGSVDGVTTCGGAGSGGAGPDVWYSFTPPCTGRYRLDTEGSAYDTVLSVHSGCPGSIANTIACDDDGGVGTTSLLTLALQKGVGYRVRVGGYNAMSGNFVLTITALAPVNDACAAATAIVSGSYTFGTCEATTDGPNELLCNRANSTAVNNDVWFRWAAPCSGEVAVGLCASDYDTRLTVYGAVCPAAPGSAIACNDDFCGLRSRLKFNAAAGVQYLVRVGGFLTSTGSGVLTIGPSADVNADGEVNANDISAYLNAWYNDILSGTLAADFDLSGETDANDISAFLNAWFQQLTSNC